MIFYSFLFIERGENMRIECQFYADKLPLSYRMGMVSLIKECLKKANPDVYQRYFKIQFSHLNS